MHDNLSAELGKIAGKQPETGTCFGMHLIVKVAWISQTILDLSVKSVPPIEPDVVFFGLVHTDGGGAETAAAQVGKHRLHQTGTETAAAVILSDAEGAQVGSGMTVGKILVAEIFENIEFSDKRVAVIDSPEFSVSGPNILGEEAGSGGKFVIRLAPPQR